jgi:hypothetical protein
MAKPKTTKQNAEIDEATAKRILAQVRIVDAAEYLKALQRQLRHRVKIFKELENLPAIPELATRELLLRLKKNDLLFVDEMDEVRDSLDIACALLKPAA